MTMEKRIHTTGRLASRMSKADLEKLQQRLQAYALDVEKDFAAFEEQELEIGMGNGLALLERAKANPNRLFIGNEIYRNGLRSLVYRLEQNSDIKNVRIVGEDAREVLGMFSAQSLDRVNVFYPDPWLKVRHQKRRIIQPELLTDIAHVLKEEGEFWFVSDIPDYVFWTIQKTREHGVFAPTAIGPQEWATAPDWWVSTKYEQKALREGRQAWYVCYSMKS
ncbi:MAG: tRNA (guanosine(46)-N7)-methyltransferase TrmB [Alphaproteobacteria bacterium]|nr:tRNA (guanosine(46)-N7)-methyltransferase TrmB [Alphaproteobacteria bacterium]MDD9920126.1 tRNA (guanosine(46)-N7)-methyltransferase TrmB [Alphaproteobacteria bacterium]